MAQKLTSRSRINHACRHIGMLLAYNLGLKNEWRNGDECRRADQRGLEGWMNPFGGAVKRTGFFSPYTA